MAEPTDEPSPSSDTAGGGIVHVDQAPGGTNPPTGPCGPWDDTSGQPDLPTVARLLREGGPGFATGADLRAAALELEGDDTAGYSTIAQHLGVPLGIVRGWLREDRARA